MISACLITYNEEELLPRCLKFLEEMPSVKEICIVDSYSTDNTRYIIQDFMGVTTKKIKVYAKTFYNFSEQRNLSLEMATEDWILIIDADETYTKNLEEFAQWLQKSSSLINAVRIPTLVMVDENNYLNKSDTDPHVRLFRRGFAKFQREVHELLTDDSGRILHGAYDNDILTTMHEYSDVWMKHWQLLKSDEALKNKGNRWESLGMIEASKNAGIPITKDFWLKVKREEPILIGVNALPEAWK